MGNGCGKLLGKLRHAVGVPFQIIPIELSNAYGPEGAAIETANIEAGSEHGGIAEYTLAAD